MGKIRIRSLVGGKLLVHNAFNIIDKSLAKLTIYIATILAIVSLARLGKGRHAALDKSWRLFDPIAYAFDTLCLIAA